MFAERDLVRQGLPLVQAVARRIARRIGPGANLDDLLGIGHLALLEAARTYDPTRASFPTYAASRMRWAMLDGFRSEVHSRSLRARAMAVKASERYGSHPEPERDEPTTQEQDQAALTEFLKGQAAALATGLLAVPFELLPGAAPTESPEELYARRQSEHVTREAVRALPERERALIERHYFGDEPFDAIARDLGISKSWASRLHDRALLVVGQAMGAPP